MTYDNARRNQISADEFAAKPILDLFQKKYGELWHAARLLGGYDASRMVDKCAARLEQQGMVDNQSAILLKQVLDILALEEADDPDKPYMGFFAAIDPRDPVVAEICLLTDQLREALELVEQRREWLTTKQSAPVEA